MSYPPREGDKPIIDILKQMNDIAAMGGQAWIKWTCPKCGERCVADESNKIHTGGYEHAGCGGIYQGNVFGLLVLLPINKEKREITF